MCSFLPPHGVGHANIHLIYVLDEVLKQFAPQGVRAVYGDASMIVQEHASESLEKKAVDEVEQDYAGHNVKSPVIIFDNMYSVLESGYFNFADGSANLPLVAVIDGTGKIQDLQGWFDGLQQRLVDDITKLTSSSHSQGSQ